MHKQILSALFAMTLLNTAQAASWDYSQHGDDWSGTCASGQHQSPINIDTSTVAAANVAGDMNYKGRLVTAVNNGHTVQFNPRGRTLQIVDNQSGQKETFTLVQFHLHNGSEHTVNGVRHAAEAHFVHANNAYLAGEVGGRLAVVGVFLDAGTGHDDDEAWNNVLANLPLYENGEEGSLDANITSNYFKLLPETSGVYAYDGSLTTPGCGELVNWFVMKDPMHVSEVALENFAASQHHHLTYRNTQPLNGRVVTSGNMIGSRN